MIILGTPGAPYQNRRPVHVWSTKNSMRTWWYPALRWTCACLDLMSVSPVSCTLKSLSTARLPSTHSFAPSLFSSSSVYVFVFSMNRLPVILAAHRSW